MKMKEIGPRRAPSLNPTMVKHLHSSTNRNSSSISEQEIHVRCTNLIDPTHTIISQKSML